MSSDFSLPLTCGVQGLAHHSEWGPSGAGELGAACSSRGGLTPPGGQLLRQPSCQGRADGSSPWASCVEEISDFVYLYWVCFPHKMMLCAYSLQLQEGGLRLAIRSGCLLRKGRNEEMTEVSGVPLPTAPSLPLSSASTPRIGLGVQLWGLHKAWTLSVKLQDSCLTANRKAAG